ncbi:hypothetical protein IMG5_112530 [Ichthyophthirius multifiliis]|uniref:Ion transport domain-containing protein n=1 Tax=Ichthyophthirius multifiliis TaxID=5932 RepID=G0QTW7_ICHMU|nr:hypothetical protein IMG5_112530 [Ichthyophthirius multifiliis]EGR31326.1 hypothetical protein IMG5_112530 [Ichthyophthirius multifiliis]|eukprot:XP_004034812.1 hypothetical protein IMG5_112530 [Ichthyophthirius multifiliis]
MGNKVILKLKKRKQSSSEEEQDESEDEKIKNKKRYNYNNDLNKHSINTINQIPRKSVFAQSKNQILQTGQKQSNENKQPQNALYWKMMINLNVEYQCESFNDIMYYQLKNERQKKDQEEQNKIKSTQYKMQYRSRKIKEETKKQKELKKEKTNKSLQKQFSKCIGQNTPQSIKTPRKINNFDQQQSFQSQAIYKSFKNSEIDIKKIKKFKIPIRKSQRVQTIQIKKMQKSLYFKENSSPSFVSMFVRVKKKNKNQLNEEKIKFTFQNITHLIKQQIVFIDKQDITDTIGIKELFQEIKVNNKNSFLYIQQKNQQRNDYQTGIKQFNIWSGSDISKKISINKAKTNKILKVLNTKHQDINIYIQGFLGVIKVLHKHHKKFVQGNIFNNMALVAVFLNTVLLALDGSFQDESTNLLLDSISEIFTYIFMTEMSLKILALGILGYIRDKMNIFDGTIVLLSVFEMIFFSGGNKAISAFRAVRIFRTFRVLRVTRLLRSLEFMSKIIFVISQTIDTFMYIALLLFLFIFIYSLLGMQIYGGNYNFPNNEYRESFDSFNKAFIAVFQILSLENWQEILILSLRSSINPAITAFYLISWIFIGNFVFLNLFMAIILDGFVNYQQQEQLQQNEGEENEGQEEENQGNESDMEEYIKNILKSQNREIQNYIYEDENNANVEQVLESNDDLFEETKNEKKKLFQGIECDDSLFIFSKKNFFRIFLYKIVQHHHFDNWILFFIIISSFKLIIDTYIPEGTMLDYFSKQMDVAFNIIFSIEACFKIIAYGFAIDNNSYLTDTWSQLDFFIVFTSMIDMSIESVDIPAIKILRLLRTLRPLRFISHNVNMKVVVIALFESVGAIFNVLIVVILIWFMFAILGISLIGQRLGYCDFEDKEKIYRVNYDQVFFSNNNTYHILIYIYIYINKTKCIKQGLKWKVYSTNFDNIISAMITIYILSSLEGWPNIMMLCIDSNTKDIVKKIKIKQNKNKIKKGPIKDNYQIIAYYFVLFILIGSFFQQTYLSVLYSQNSTRPKKTRIGKLLFSQQKSNLAGQNFK